MSATLEAKTAMRQLAVEAKTVMESKSFSDVQKKAKLAELEVRLKGFSDTIALHESAGRFGVGGGALGGSDGLDGGLDGWVGKGGPSLALEPGQQEALFKAAHDRMPISVKTVATGNVDPSRYPMQYLPPVLAAREPTRILDLLPTSGTSAGVIEFYTTTGTAAAAAVAEATLKPQSSIAYTKVTASATKIAHYVDVSEEALSDFGAFGQLLSQDMVGGLVDAENRELLNANGTAPSMFKGLLQVAGTQSYVRLVVDSVLDAIEIAASQLRAGGRFVSPDGVIMHPLDYSAARRTKASTGEYVGGVNVFGAKAPVTGDPAGASRPELWGLPVVLTSEIAQGTAVVGAFAQATMVWIREAATVRVNPYAKQTSNIVEIIAEERLTLGVLAPAALSIVTVSTHA